MRLLRDLAILVVGAATIFGIVAMVNRFSKAREPKSPDNLSSARQLADESLEPFDLKAIIATNRVLIEQDPFNGHARYRLAQGLLQQVTESRYDLLNLIDEFGTEHDLCVVAREELKPKVEEAIESFYQCVNFARYRRQAFANIALLHTFVSQDDQAIDVFRRAVQDGYSSSRRGGRSRFSTLDPYPKFWALRAQEMQNLNGNYQPVDESESYFIDVE